MSRLLIAVAVITGCALPAFGQVAAPADTDTVVQRAGLLITLPGAWSVRDAMWDDAALVFDDDSGWWSLDAGERSPRCLYDRPMAHWSAPAWSLYGRQLFVWLEVERQFTSIELHSGSMRSITALELHRSDREGHQRMDPSPVWRAGGVVEEPVTGLLLQLLQQESNDQVATSRRSAVRTGGYTLVGFDEGAGEMLPVSVAPMPGEVVSWDIAPLRKRLFVLDTAGTLVERRLNGELVRELPVDGARRIALSPDERTLLVERTRRDEQPGGGYVRRDSGCVLIDLDSGQPRAGSDEGQWFAWSPDGRRLAYVVAAGLRVLDVQQGARTEIASRPPLGSHTFETGAGSWRRPVWSPDGHRLSVSIGSTDFSVLLVDLDRREVLALPLSVDDALWSRVPRPFPQGFVPSDP